MISIQEDDIIQIEQNNGLKLPLFVDLYGEYPVEVNREKFHDFVSGYILKDYYKEIIQDIAKILNLSKVPILLKNVKQEIDNYYFYLYVCPNDHIKLRINKENMKPHSYVYFQASINGNLDSDITEQLYKKHASDIIKALTIGDEIVIKI